jgi:dihydroflavonol-4-reductase
MNLIVGSTGFVGGHLVEYLFQQGEISKGTFRKGSFLKIMDANGVQGIEADLLDHDSLHEAVEGADVIYSLASPAPEDGGELMRVNTEGMMNLLEVATEMNVKKVVHLSTVDVYGFGTSLVTRSSRPAPGNMYQKAKLSSENVITEFASRSGAPRYTIIRAARAVGPRDRTLIVPLLRMIESGSVAIPSSSVMSFTHPKDIAQAMYLAATRESTDGKVFLVKSFDSEPAQLAAELARALGKSVKVRNAGLFSRPPMPKYTVEQLRACLRLEAEAEWAELGYSPKYGLVSTCQEVAEWVRREPWATEQV